MRKPPPPMLPAEGWVTASANAVATAASTALPPSHRTSTPTWEATKFWEATIPLRARAGTPAAAGPAVARTATAVSSRSLMSFPSSVGRRYYEPHRDTLREEVIVLQVLLLFAAAAAPATMRLDYVHTGDAREEHYALDAVVREGAWPGPPDRRIDDTNLGRYLFEVRDSKSGETVYSRGFASMFGEWETTPEAKDRPRGFHESVRFPEPGGPVTITIKKRTPRGLFEPAWSVRVDPADPAVDRRPPPGIKVWALMKNGEPADKVDLLLLGDGYTAGEMDKWHRDVKRLADTLFATSPFKEHRGQFNVWAADTPSEDSGVSRPSDGVYRRTALGATYDAFGSERYVLDFDDKRLREVASAAPYEFIEIVVNDRKYGGGGIHNLYATVAADNAFTPYVFVHEFVHHFAGLAYEYYTSPLPYQAPAAAERPEPWEPNATADPQAAKWRDLVSPGLPLPTPWLKKEFE